jgi:hypothetical protein
MKQLSLFLIQILVKLLLMIPHPKSEGFGNSLTKLYVKRIVRQWFDMKVFDLFLRYDVTITVYPPPPPPCMYALYGIWQGKSCTLPPVS